MRMLMPLLSLIALSPMGAQTIDSTSGLSAAQIADAISAGQGADRPLVVLAGSAGDGFQAKMLRSTSAGHAIYITGPFDRVANAARSNKKKYIPFTADSVQSWMTAPVLMVRIDPTSPKDINGNQPPSIEHVVLIPKGEKGTAVQPQQLEKNTVQWQNGFGATFAATGLYALFNLNGVPKGDFDVVVITSGKEARYKIGADDIARSLRSSR